MIEHMKTKKARSKDPFHADNRWDSIRAVNTELTKEQLAKLKALPAALQQKLDRLVKTTR